MTRRARTVAAAAGALSLAAAFTAAAQPSVDRYEFEQMSRRVEAAEAELNRLRNAMAGGDFLSRFEQLSGEIRRLTSEVEELSFRVRQHEDAARRKLEDLEYRIIELEGGDPTVLFQQSEPAPAAPQAGAPAPVESAPGPVGTLGTLNLDATGAPADVGAPERAAYDAAIGAARAGRTDEAISLLRGFVATFPDSRLAGDAYFRLGEQYYAAANYQRAASSFLDSATLYPTSAVAPDALVRLGVTLTLMGQRDVACSTFQEVSDRYAGSPAASQAASEAQRAGCL